MKNMKTYFLLLLFALTALLAWATVSEYSFASTLGTFTEISGGTVLGTATNDEEVFPALPLGFTFTYNGIAYTQVSVASNGFLALGAEVATAIQPLSSATGTNNVVAAIGRNIKSRDTGELMYLLSGTEPNRVFTVQWKHWRRSATSTASDDFSFQIQLQENGNKVVFVYGAFTAVTSSTNQAIQVGIRGDANTDFNNRTTTTDWAATSPGTANNNFCALSATVFPASGLNFSFSPPATGEPPLAAVNPNPAHNATNVAIAANLSWVSGGGTVDGYELYLGTDNPPSNIVDGAIQTGTSYNPVDFAYLTTYYWQIVPFNSFGDAANCPIWSFTTLADPTVSTFPYNQNFDALTVPALPPGWTTINANADAYTWETYAGTAQSQPNCARVRFNSTLAMNDWLLLPPMQLTQGTNYKLRFFYRGGSTDGAEKLALFWGAAPTADSLNHQLWVNENVNNVTYRMGEGVIQAPANGIYHFGFKGYSAADLFYIYLDTVSFDVWVEQLLPPTNLTATISGFDVHLAWTAPAIQRALLGYKVFRNSALLATITNPDSLAYHDLGLTSGLYNYAVTAVYTSGESVPAGPIMADVAPVLLPPANLTATVLQRDVTLNWTNPEGNWITWSGMTLANTMGNNAAIVFDAAHRWTQEDLAPYAGRSISRIEFIPTWGSCVYTIKVWTGGTAAGPGTLVHSQVATNLVTNEWNSVLLNAHVPIPATGDLYYGYECNTTGGRPAGGDAGPQIEGKGNMINFMGQWQTLTQVSSTLTYNFAIRAFTQIPAPARAPEPGPLMASSRSADRVITGYKVYRDAVLLATINDEEVLTYLDAGLPNATYNYTVTSVTSAGESEPASVTAVVNFQLAAVAFEDGFEAYPDFATTFAPWFLRDVDQSTTFGITDVTFPGSGTPLSYIIFNPSATTPPITTLTPHGGAKMAASFAATTAPNNDWLVTPRIQMGTNSAIKFFARSHSDQYGLERFRVGVNTLPVFSPPAFQYVSGPDPEGVAAPVTWHEYVYDLSAYDNQLVTIGFRCISNDAFVFYLDDISVHSNGGHVANDDPGSPALRNELAGNYPNPFNPETTISFSTAAAGPVQIDIYNIKGQLVRSLLDEHRPAGNHSLVFNGLDNSGRPLASGVYFQRMQAGKFNATRKMILLK